MKPVVERESSLFQKLRRGLNEYGPGAIGLIGGIIFVYEIGLAYLTCEKCDEIYRNPFIATFMIGPFVLVLVISLTFYFSHPAHERGQPIRSLLLIVFASIALGFMIVLGLPFAFLGILGLPGGALESCRVPSVRSRYALCACLHVDADAQAHMEEFSRRQ